MHDHDHVCCVVVYMYICLVHCGYTILLQWCRIVCVLLFFCWSPVLIFRILQHGIFLGIIIMLVHCLKVLDSELKAYSGIVKDLGKEAEKLKKSDPANAKEIAAEQVCYGCILLCVCLLVMQIGCVCSPIFQTLL